MKTLDLKDLPNNFLLWRYPENHFSVYHKCVVPQGMEVVVIKSDVTSGPFRSGDQFTAGRNRKLFSRSKIVPETIYFIKEDQMRPILWGMGDLPCLSPSGNQIFFGANGQLILSIVNARTFAKAWSTSDALIDMQGVESRIGLYIAEHVRPVLTLSVSSLGLQSALKSLQEMSEEAASSLESPLSELGLEISSFAINELYWTNEE